jgi:flagellar basal-body rod protein FlgB
VFLAVFSTKKAANVSKMTNFDGLARLLLIFAVETNFLRRTQELYMSQANNIVDILAAGIRAESLRQKTIANNVANLQTPGYRRFEVKFEELLAKALDSPGAVDLSDIELEIYQPQRTTVKSNGNDVSLEVEVGEMVKNTLRHKAYIRLLQKKYQQIELAIAVK